MFHFYSSELKRDIWKAPGVVTPPVKHGRPLWFHAERVVFCWRRRDTETPGQPRAAQARAQAPHPGIALEQDHQTHPDSDSPSALWAPPSKRCHNICHTTLSAAGDGLAVAPLLPPPPPLHLSPPPSSMSHHGHHHQTQEGFWSQGARMKRKVLAGCFVGLFQRTMQTAVCVFPPIRRTAVMARS